MTPPRVLRALRMGARLLEHFDTFLTSRDLPLADVRRAEAAGLVREAGLVVVCDADGFAREPERYRMGYTLTDAGRAALKADA